jgi:hypothetical protein
MCVNGVHGIPLAKTGLVSDGKNVHLMCISATHLSTEKSAELEVYFVRHHPAHTTNPLYYSLVGDGPDIATETIGKQQSRLGLELCGRNGIIRYRFKLTKTGFCNQSIKLILDLCDCVGITDKSWIAGVKIYSETEVLRGKAWRDFSSDLLFRMGLVPPFY